MSNADRIKDTRARILNDARDVEADITDMLTNLRHLCEHEALDFDKINERAARHYAEEVLHDE